MSTLMRATCAILAALIISAAGAVTVQAAAEAPRASAELGKLSIVALTSNGKLLVFVDRTEDNAPVDDATLALQTPSDGVPVRVERLSSGLFTSPWRDRRSATTIHVHVASAALASEGDVDLTLPGPPPIASPATPEPAPSHPMLAALMGFAAAILLVALRTLWQLTRPRRNADAHVLSRR